ncbi:hypothetical protein Cyan10605_3485 (plasmid) [Cyanobacterium aponinum PCC 10605]|uniref:Uncharacterized protein n=1 Tax=Cyanobacterium aponinum (strain PCC 10605) TaxID=755178 RepID=K9ZA99_CYAAP|nr:hypothetical protein Cyan10605_3485 [Cyanobacterium aponinum PCC 10605]
MQLRILSLITCFVWGRYCPVEIKTEIKIDPEDSDSSLILFIDEQEQNWQ